MIHSGENHENKLHTKINAFAKLSFPEAVFLNSIHELEPRTHLEYSQKL